MADDYENPRSYLECFCLNTSCHGVADLYKTSRRFTRVLWAALLIVCFGVLIYNVDVTLRNFLDSERQWATTVYYDNNAVVPFPTVTVCNINRIRRSVAAEYDMDEELQAVYFAGFPADYIFPMMPNITVPDGLADSQRLLLEAMTKKYSLLIPKYVEWKAKHQLDFQRTLDRFSHQCADMFMRVWVPGSFGLRGSEFCNGLTNSSVRVTPVIYPEFGLCYQLDVSAIVSQVVMPGTMNSLNIMLDSEMMEHLPMVRMNHMQQGFAVVLSYNGAPTFGSSILISTGRHTHLAMSQRRSTVRSDTIMFNPPCLTKNEQKLKYFPNEFYSKHQCEIECIVEMEKKSCGIDCIPFIKSPSFPMCQIEESLQCRVGNIVADQAAYHETVTDCTTACIESCEHSTVNAVISSTPFPSEAQIPTVQYEMLNIMGRNYSEEEIRNGLAVITIYYSTLAVEVVERYVRITSDELIARLGGHMGIWAGISVLTVAQALGYCGAFAVGKLTGRARIYDEKTANDKVAKKNMTFVQPKYPDHHGKYPVLYE